MKINFENLCHSEYFGYILDILYTLDNFVTMETLEIFDTLVILVTLDTLDILKNWDILNNLDNLDISNFWNFRHLEMLDIMDI